MGQPKGGVGLAKLLVSRVWVREKLQTAQVDVVGAHSFHLGSHHVDIVPTNGSGSAAAECHPLQPVVETVEKPRMSKGMGA
jgi:hypothetical protein